jgi:nucleotide-binding universal stress UspA family protein
VSEIHPVQVVVAYDMSPSAEAALARAVEVAARAPQHVLHVVTALDTHGSYVTAEQIHHLIRDHVRMAFDGRPTASEIQFFIHVRFGKPADTVLRVAEEVGADLLFIGSHNKAGIERFLLGSVSERVVREAKCPVMVVRPKGYENVDLLKVFLFPLRARSRDVLGAAPLLVYRDAGDRAAARLASQLKGGARCAHACCSW